MSAEPTRRSVVRAALVAAIGGVAGFAVARSSDAARASNGTTAANAYGPSKQQTTRLLAKVDDVPAGGGVILRGAVLTRTASGEVHAFSPVCTHQGCRVDRVAGGRIDCPCHGSSFDANTGAVRAGPAPRPLPKIAITVRNGGIYPA